MYPFMREPEKLTLKQFKSKLKPEGTTTVIDTSDISCRLSATEGIQVEFPIGKKKQSLPITGGGHDGFVQLADWVGVPPKFLARQERDLQVLVLNELLRRNPGEVAIVHGEVIENIRNPHTISPTGLDLIEAVARVLPTTSEVIDHYNTSRMFQADIAVPVSSKIGVGGDPKVKDITRAGVKIGVDIQHGKAPYIQPWLYRLVCTNGMEVPDPSMVVTLRGRTVPEIIDEMEGLCQTIWGRMDHTIEEFYKLRDQKIAHDQADTVMRRTIQEHNLPIRGERHDALIEAATNLEDPTMFDVVNLITHEANNPDLDNNPSQRRRLEVAGGNIMGTFVERCSHCQSVLHTHHG